MTVAVFRSRLRPEAKDEYLVMAKRLSAIVAATPGYLSHKLFTRRTQPDFSFREHLRGVGAAIEE